MKQNKFRIQEVLNTDEIRNFISTSDLRGLQAVGVTWAIIIFSFFIVGYYPSVFTIVLALILLGGRHLALAILMHDTAHYSLFKTRALNDWVGTYLCAFPAWQDLKCYRKHHLLHHQYAGSKKDPDFDLVEAYPVTRTSLKRKFFRDLSGITGLKRLYGVLLIDFGYIQYTVSSNVVPLDQSDRTWESILKTGLQNSAGKWLAQLVLLGILTILGKPWLYLLWIGSYLTVFSLFIRIRSIAEHACTIQDLDPLKNTRTTYAGILARLTVAPHRVNYHLEHHLLMTVPYFKLPQLHRVLLERGALKSAFVASNYVEVLKQASSLIPSPVK